MTDRSAHELYKELTRELNALSSDVVKGLGAIKFLAESNKDDIAELKSELRRRLEALDRLVKELEKQEAANAVRLQALEEARRDHTGQLSTLTKAEGALKLQAETTGGRWAFWVAIIGGAAGVVSAIINALMGS